MRDIRVAVNGFEAKVVGVIKAKRGFVYKIDNLLPFRWNDGPTLSQLASWDGSLTKLNFLLRQLPPDTLDQVRFGNPAASLHQAGRW